jgi:hypothetical protein
MSETIPATKNQIHLSSEKWKTFLDEAEQYAIKDEEITKNVFNQMKEFRDNFEMKEFSNLKPWS